jgi:hypothetical protein
MFDSDNENFTKITTVPKIVILLLLLMALIALWMTVTFLKKRKRQKNREKEKEKEKEKEETTWHCAGTGTKSGAGAGASAATDNSIASAENILSQENECQPFFNTIDENEKLIIQGEINRQLSSIGNIHYTVPLTTVKNIDTTNATHTLTLTSTTPLIMTRLIFDHINSKVCSNSMTVVGKAFFSVDDLMIKLFNNVENFGKTIFEADITVEMLTTEEKGVYAVQFQSIVINNLTFFPVLLTSTNHAGDEEKKRGITWLISLSINSLTNYINRELARVVTNSPDAIILSPPISTRINENENLEEKEEKKELNKFLVDTITSSLALTTVGSSATFKICETCPDSTLQNIQLGKTVWIENGGCDGFLMLGGCAGCSWGYRAGVNSIQGLDTLKLTPESLNINNIVTDTNSNNIRVYFSFGLNSDKVFLFVTSQVISCSKNIYSPGWWDDPVNAIADSSSSNDDNNNNIAVKKVDAKMIVYVHDSYIDGVYDQGSKMVLFNSNSIKIGNVSIALTLDNNSGVDWMTLNKTDNISEATNNEDIKNNGEVEKFIQFIKKQEVLQNTLSLIIRSSIQPILGQKLEGKLQNLPNKTLSTTLLKKA